MKSRGNYLLRGLVGFVAGLAGLALVGPSVPLVIQLGLVAASLSGIVVAMAHPTVGPTKLTLRLARGTLLLGGAAFLGSVYELRAMPRYWVAGLALAIIGTLVLYGTLLKIPWDVIGSQMDAYRYDENPSGSIIPPHTVEWVVWKSRTLVILITAGVMSAVFPPRGIGGWLLVGTSVALAVVIGFASPFELPVDRVVAVHKAVFAIGGGGFVVAGIAPYFASGGSGPSFLTAIIGTLVLYHGTRRVSWTRVRKLAELRRDGQLHRSPGLREWYSSSKEPPKKSEASETRAESSA
ncbi:hypothetical protein BRD04_08945 [Halobacteriales archaeon QS_9_67_17]|nr:MAG: hypothetical protein BRD04_08945 [Halobacteriales archaeon QS_9_67_17]